MTNDTMSPFGTYRLPPFKARLLALAQSLPGAGAGRWLGRKGALFLRRRVLGGRLAIIDAEVEGLKLRLYMQDNVSERKFLFMPQFFDPQERGMIRYALREGGVFVDIGANAGIYTLTAAKAGAGRVLSVEPNPLVLQRLAYNAALNGFDGVIATEQCGVSDAAGSFDLVLDKTNLGGSSLVNSRSDEKITVPCLPLADIVRKHGLPRIDALKIDIEGAEDKAIVPYLETAPRDMWPRLLILENSPGDWTRDLPDILSQCGYRKVNTTRMNIIWQLS